MEREGLCEAIVGDGEEYVELDEDGSWWERVVVCELL